MVSTFYDVQGLTGCCRVGARTPYRNVTIVASLKCRGTTTCDLTKRNRQNQNFGHEDQLLSCLAKASRIIPQQVISYNKKRKSGGKGE